ncbi:MAG TPA: hypothetical protein VGF80_04290 [Galbitalea sp.]|jgi:hypothetical protein
MKRINYDGQSLVSGSAVVSSLVEYAQAVARMDSSATVEIPVLEDNGTVAMHTLLLTAATSLETFDIDGGHADEDDRFPVPDFAGVGGKATPISDQEISTISLPIPD